MFSVRVGVRVRVRFTFKNRGLGWRIKVRGIGLEG